MQTGAQNMDMMLAGRFFAGESMSTGRCSFVYRSLGFGVGIVSDLAPLYQVRIFRAFAYASIEDSWFEFRQKSRIPVFEDD